MSTAASASVPASVSASTSACLPCRMEESEAGAVMFRDDLWSCEVAPGYEVPGWFVLRVRRHALNIGGLSGPELATYARRLRDVVGAVGEVTGAPATYVLVFGEANPHFHTLIAPRGDEVAPETRLGRILDLRENKLDWAASLALVPQVAQAYARLAAQTLEPQPQPLPLGSHSLDQQLQSRVQPLEAGG